MDVERVVLSETYVDSVEDELLLVKKLDYFLDRVKHSRERLVVLICDEERKVVQL